MYISNLYLLRKYKEKPSVVDVFQAYRKLPIWYINNESVQRSHRSSFQDMIMTSLPSAWKWEGDTFTIYNVNDTFSEMLIIRRHDWIIFVTHIFKVPLSSTSCYFTRCELHWAVMYVQVLKLSDHFKYQRNPLCY